LKQKLEPIAERTERKAHFIEPGKIEAPRFKSSKRRCRKLIVGFDSAKSGNGKYLR
jgi:hypothetical protein